MRSVLVALGTIAVLAGQVMAQSPQTAQPASPAATGPTFDVISIKPNTSNAGGFSTRLLPGGGYGLVNGPVRLLIGSAYPGLQSEPEGLPPWAITDRFDVTATASQTGMPSAEDRRAMILALLASRFKFAAHIETREQPAFDLVVARSDGRLGPGIKPSEVDCAARAAAQRAAAEAARAAGTPPPPPPTFPPTFTPPAPGSPLPPCTTRMINNLIEGDFTMSSLASFLRTRAGRYVVDKTGLAGNYRIRLEGAGSPLGPTVNPTAAAGGDVPSVFTAVQEQLGLKLEPSRAMVEVLVVDHIERPTEN
jgi:uncharacterized protein (TIGR03435 family)